MGENECGEYKWELFFETEQAENEGTHDPRLGYQTQMFADIDTPIKNCTVCNGSHEEKEVPRL
jgi:hypothetical protein